MTSDARSNIFASLVLQFALLPEAIGASAPSTAIDSIGHLFQSRPISQAGDGKTPCDIPHLDDEDFSIRCFIGYSEKRYLCDPDQAISAKEIDRIESDILKKANFYHYCPPCEKTYDTSGKEKCECKGENAISIRKNGQPIAQGNRLSEWRSRNDSTAVRVISKRQKGYHNQFVKQRDELPPVFIAVNIYSKIVFPRSLRMVQRHLPCALPLLGPASIDTTAKLDDDKVIKAYGQLSEERWRNRGNCHPNLTILVFLGDVVVYTKSGKRMESYSRPRLHVQHTFGNQKSMIWLNSTIDQVINELNHENSTLTSGSDKLYKFLEKFTYLYEQAHRPRRHTIPLWAAITFGVCSVLSVCAVMVGNVVTSADRRGSRKSKHSTKGQGPRKWRAGFSGGMWASV